MDLVPLNIVFEDQISEFVMLKMLEYVKGFYVGFSYSEGGFGYIKKNMRGWNEAAKGCPFFVLTDLDERTCAPSLIREWIPSNANPNLIFRVAVREVETWLLADIESFSKFVGVSKANFSENVEEILDPKGELLRIVKRSTKRQLKLDVLPKDEFAKIGPYYNDRLCEYVSNQWNIESAMLRSNSLLKAVIHLTKFKMNYNSK